MIFVRRILLALFVCCVTTSAQGTRNLERDKASGPQSGKRIALIIGNGAYTSAPPLKNPPNDARDMATTLKALGFDVTSGINVNQRDFKRLIREFGQKLKAGGSGLFYYAGHGVQSKGRNYLIPVDAEIQSEADVEDTGVDLSLILNYMDEADNGLNIVILDACRNNPFARSFRSATGGLAQVDAPTGTLIAYATAPGTVASDGTNQNGLYTSELLKQMRVPDLSATDMFMRVRAEVMKKTASKQVPWEASSLIGAFYFTAQASTSATTPNGETPTGPRFDPSAFELSYWESIKNSTDPADYKDYLAKYPNGQFTDLARRRSTSLASAPAGTSAKPPTNPEAEGHIKSGDDLAKQLKWPEAEVEFRLAVRLDPARAEYHNKLGFVLHTNSKFAEAETEYKTALRLAPSNAESHFGVGRALREQKKLVEAEAELREAVRLEPGTAKYHAALAVSIGIYQAKYADAEVEMGQAIRIESDSPDWRNVLAQVLFSQKKYTEAEVQSREAVRLAPTISSNHSLLSQILVKQDKYADGESEAREAIRLNPKDSWGLWMLGISLFYQNKDLTGAEAALREAVRLDPDSKAFHQTLGLVLDKLGKKSEAAVELAAGKDPLLKQAEDNTRTNALEGTTWTGDADNGKDHFQFMFAANGEVIRQWKRSLYPDTFKGTWIKVGNTITMEFNKSITCDRKMEMTVDGNKITGTYCDGKNKFTLEKAP